MRVPSFGDSTYCVCCTTESPRKERLDVDRAAGHAQRFGPESRGGLREFNYVANRADEFIQLFGSHRQRRGGLQNHEVVAADLRQDSLLAKHPHHHDLPKHRWMDLTKPFVQGAKREFLWRNEFDSAQETHAPDFLDHLEACQLTAQLRPKCFAELQCTRAKILAFQNVQRGQSSSHG